MEKPSSPAGANSDGAQSASAITADEAVRQALVEGHRQILSFLKRRLGNADRADDVLQAFMVRALARSSDLRDVQTARGWLSRILATTIADHQRREARKHKREVGMNSDEVETLPIEADEEIDQAICNCLHKLLPTLKQEYAEVVRRVDLLGESREGVAASLGVSLNNVTVRLHRGRQALKLRLEEMCLTCPEHGFLDCGCEEAERGRRRREELAAEL
jgi:RNA polymerase sigma-70 factor (ECF subfamily)